LPSEPGHANGYGESGSDSDDTASPLKAAKRARARSGASAAARALIQQMKAQHKVLLAPSCVWQLPAVMLSSNELVHVRMVQSSLADPHDRPRANGIKAFCVALRIRVAHTAYLRTGK